MAEPSYDELKKELEQVRKERDGYRESLKDLLKRFYDIDLDKDEAELRDWVENGRQSAGTIEELIAELESKLGPAA